MSDATDRPLLVELGLTIQWGDMGFIKPRIALAIDPAGDIEAQIKEGLDASTQVFAAIDGHMERVIADLISPNTGEPGFNERIAQVEKSLIMAKKNMLAMKNKIDELIAARRTDATVEGAVT